MLRQTTLFTTSLLIFTAAGILAACGGGASSDPDPDPTPLTAATGTASPPGSGQSAADSDSTRLVDNPLGPDASFDNFAASQPTVPVTSYEFVGDRVYVKLGRMDGEVLFLGQVARDRDFNIPAHLPLTESMLAYEIFSDSAADEIVFGEITL